jgi:DnaK suppressor protein
LEEIENTKELIKDFKEMTQPIEPDNAYGRLSRMDAIQSKSVKEAALRQAEDRLNKLNYAYSKLDSPEFGKCKNCGVSIPLQRILLVPESPYCVKCSR